MEAEKGHRDITCLICQARQAANFGNSQANSRGRCEKEFFLLNKDGKSYVDPKIVTRKCWLYRESIGKLRIRQVLRVKSMLLLTPKKRANVSGLAKAAKT